MPSPEKLTLRLAHTVPVVAPRENNDDPLALILPDGRHLILEDVDDMGSWLALALACLRAAEVAALPSMQSAPDARWHGMVPALGMLLDVTLDASNDKPFQLASPTVVMAAAYLGHEVYGGI
jgi:hypothetical protein